MDLEGGIKPNLIGIIAQDPGTDSMEGPGPSQPIDRNAAALAHRQASYALDPPRHLGSRAAGKGHEQDPARIGTVDDQMSDPVRQSVGLARSSACDDKERPAGRRILLAHAILDGAELFDIKFFEIGRRHWIESAGAGWLNEPCFLFCSNWLICRKMLGFENRDPHGARPCSQEVSCARQVHSRDARDAAGARYQ